MPKITPTHVVLIFLAGALIFALLAVGSITTWEYTNSDDFCTNACHSVHPEEPVDHRNYYHARVKCVECHIGRFSTLKTMALKTEHIKELWGMVAGYERPQRSTTLRPARDSCERCHWPAAFHYDTLLSINHYAEDKPSTRTRTELAMHTGGGLAREGRGKGIHWHVENRVEFVATDAKKQHIPWVHVTYQDGRTVTYSDPEQPLTPEQLAQAPRRIMDCVDCHNRVGHPFPNPADIVDQALATGQLNRALPFIKKRAMLLIDKAMEEDRQGDFTEAEARALAAQAAEDYRQEFPEQAARDADSIKAAREEMTRLLLRVTFQAPGVSWRSFPQNTGHRDFPGCFRCHDGKHVNSTGEAIPLQCNLCHDIPRVQREGEPPSPPTLAVPGVTPLPSHSAADFMHTHGSLVDATCEGCHGKIEYGADNKSFCSNPACHGRQWLTFEPSQPAQ